MMKEQSFGASSNKVSDWQAIDWPKVRRNVRRLQLRIAKAIRAAKYGKAKALSWLLTHSRSAKLLAVKRVTENKGAKTPGVDNKLWRTDRQKYAAVQNLKRRGYWPLPLRRHYIPKKNGKLRPLSIPSRNSQNTISARFRAIVHILIAMVVGLLTTPTSAIEGLLRNANADKNANIEPTPRVRQPRRT